MNKPAKPRILPINGGSSSIKFVQYEAYDALGRILEGEIDRIEAPEAGLRLTGLVPMDTYSRPVTAPDHTVANGTDLTPHGHLSLGANPYPNSGLLLNDLRMSEKSFN